ncbi:TPR repeat containing exported protein; Putative periplasmic protein contains a protein prenylyltransferase domain [hydrothermal vent metagenome]|uniref:TPR repeat containing exported protein Putative periplasmic protein contains a protein prenylyltransferase domain n=1 Tax=hydrothermal vent metagenome TaxID=652676 RepID=A0A3B0XX48_9ZZZZ
MSLRTVNFLVKSSLFSLLIFTASSNLVFAESNLSDEQRLSRLENLFKNQVLVEQTQRMEQIQQELTALRELVESQENQLQMIKQRQRNLYQDMDRRLNDLEIKGGGQGASSKNTSSTAPSGGSPVPPPGAAVAATSVASASPTPAADGDKNGKAAYTQAFNTLKEGKYQQAISAFNAFQQTYPDSVYGANAQYWLGETYSVTRDYKTALAEFQKVIKQYPQSSKVEGAMLKIGYTYYEMRDWASAKASLEAVISQFPNTTVSRKAKERLQRMKREGH